jgi:hypothetical protein
MAAHASDRFDEALGINRLEHPCIGASDLSFGPQRAIGFVCQDKNRKAGMPRVTAHVANEREAIHLRKVDIADNDVDLASAENLQSFAPVLCLNHIETLVREAIENLAPTRRGIVNCKNAWSL